MSAYNYWNISVGVEHNGPSAQTCNATPPLKTRVATLSAAQSVAHSRWTTLGTPPRSQTDGHTSQRQPKAPSSICALTTTKH